MTNIKSLPKELQKIAELELKELPENITKYLKVFKTWIEQQPHLKARLDEQFLIQFLRYCKYDLEKAKKRIDLFFTLKTMIPEFSNATDVNDKKFRKLHKYGIGIPLPRPLNDNGARIYFAKFEGDVGRGLFDIDDIYSVITAMNEIMLMEDPYACINGIIYIWDLKEVTEEMALKYTPQFMQKVVYYILHSIPLRVCSGHLINLPKIFQSAIDIIMPMFKDKSGPQIYVYGENYDELYKIVPKIYLPMEYGGENGCRKELVKDYNKKWSEYENYFKENAEYGTNEQLRPGKSFDFNSLGNMSESLNLN